MWRRAPEALTWKSVKIFHDETQLKLACVKSLHFLTFGLLTCGGLVRSTEVKQVIHDWNENLWGSFRVVIVVVSPSCKLHQGVSKGLKSHSSARSQDGCCYTVQEMSTHLRADALGDLGTISWSWTLSPDILRCEYYILPSSFWIAQRIKGDRVWGQRRTLCREQDGHCALMYVQWTQEDN